LAAARGMEGGWMAGLRNSEKVWVAAEPPAAPDGIDLIVEGIGQLCSVHAPPWDQQGPRRGAGLRELGMFNGAALAVSAGRIVAVGENEAVQRAVTVGPRTRRQNLDGRAVVPAFVDPHTHAIFGRTRQDEYERRIRGETYLDIAAGGGGIHASVRDLRERNEDELVGLGVRRLRRLLSHGTTTVEIKSGYGLTLAAELKMLRAARRAAAAAGLRTVLTCLAAHEVPAEYRGRRAEYLELVRNVILPAVVRERLAQRCDVFCEPTVFNLEETESLLRAAQALGLGTTVHADELEAFGGAALAARLGAQSADHLIKIDPAGREALAASPTVAVLLPGTVFTLGLSSYAPARELIADGVAVALATDYNPGSCPISSVPLIMAIACTQMRMEPAEALVAATLNAAWALGLQADVGSLAPGKWADFLVLDGDDYRLIPYEAGHNPVVAVYREGCWVAGKEE
jgi:imidazolonepropionase